MVCQRGSWPSARNGPVPAHADPPLPAARPHWRIPATAKPLVRDPPKPHAVGAAPRNTETGATSGPGAAGAPVRSAWRVCAAGIAAAGTPSRSQCPKRVRNATAPQEPRSAGEQAGYRAASRADRSPGAGCRSRWPILRDIRLPRRPAAARARGPEDARASGVLNASGARPCRNRRRAWFRKPARSRRRKTGG